MQRGFTLIEIAIGIAIVTLLLAAIFKGASMIDQARVQDTLAIAGDLSGAARAFKQRYHYLPGDFPVNAAAPEIPDIPVNCATGGANAGDGNGVISVAESICVPAHLFAAGFTKGGGGEIRSPYGTVRVIANSISNVAVGPNPLPATVFNVIEFANLPCAVALELDRKVDDGSLATGRVRASVSTCQPEVSNDPVPFLAIPL